MITRKRKAGSNGPLLSPESQDSNNLTLTKEMRKSRQVKAKKVLGDEWKTDEPKKTPVKFKTTNIVSSTNSTSKNLMSSTRSLSSKPRPEKQNKTMDRLKQQKLNFQKLDKPKNIDITPLKQSKRIVMTNKTEISPVKLPNGKSKLHTEKNPITPNKQSKRVTKKNPDIKEITPVRPTKGRNKINTVINIFTPLKQTKRIRKMNTAIKDISPLISPKGKSAINAERKIITPLKQSKRISKLNTDKKNSENVDIYEFTYDPKEEPPPQKKKRTVRKKQKPTQKKTYNYNNNYDKNVSKALSALKNVISTKTKRNDKQNNNVAKAKLQNIQEIAEITTTKTIQPQNSKTVNNNMQSSTKHIETNQSDKPSELPTPVNYNSIRIEDIAADFEVSDNQDDFNYSPVYSPEHSPSPNPRVSSTECPPPTINNRDPLNLQGDLSFFDDQPVANSSMIKSVRYVAPSPRHPLASPWRVEFGSLPIKWQINTYIKPNMTPAVESSFIAENTKKHVYTNLLPTNDGPQIFEKNTSNMKQPSIISFIKEMVEKSAKKRGSDMSPIKANSLFEDSIHSHANATSVNNAVTPNKVAAHISTPNKDVLSPLRTITNLNNKENSNRKKDKENKITKSPRKQNKDRTYFGFDVTDDIDQENLSPVKVIENRRIKALRPRSRAVLQEINGITGPTRAALPTKAKIIASSDAVNQMYENLKSAEDAPVFVQKEIPKDSETIAVDEDDSNDGESVHLFEDIDVVHYMKPHRKSYGKPKKVMFSHTTMTGADQNSDAEHSGSDVDDLADLNFSTAVLKEKKLKKKRVKNLRSKKEEKEANEWAAAFNSMCEDIDQFPLVVE